MKKIVPFLFVFFLFTLNLLWSQKDQVVKISPNKPKIGDNITITYNPNAKNAILQNVNEMTAEVLSMVESGNPILHEIKMDMKGKLWTASFKLTDENVGLLLFRFISGDKKDENGEDVWRLMVYGKDNKPLMGAHFQLGQALTHGVAIDFRCKKDKDAGKAEFLKEKELYPNNILLNETLWYSQMREKPGEVTKATIKEELYKLYDFYKNDDSKTSTLLYWFDEIDQKEKTDEIIKAGIASNPKGKIAQASQRREIYKEKDNNKRVELLEKFLNDFTDLKNEVRESYQNQLVYALIQAKEYDKAASLLETLQKKDGNMYNSLAWPLIEKNERLEKAVEWAKKGIDIYRNPDPSSKPSYLSFKSWKKNSEYGLGMILDTYAYGLYQLGKTDEAEKAYEEAYKIDKGNDVSINERYVECLLKNSKFDKTLEISSECLNKGKTNDKLIAYLKTSYTKVKGSEQGFTETVDAVKNKAKNGMKTELKKKLVNKPSIDFNLKGLDGKFVKLSDLKGKIVVLDFWATWCGPCKASFPALQKIYDKYKNDPNIIILALDTWENEKGEEKEKNVKKFIEENKYTFPVLFDEDFVSKYDVEGIPTKFIIDKEGKIQFKSVGFLGEQKMIDEMEIMFEILYGDNSKASQDTDKQSQNK